MEKVLGREVQDFYKRNKIHYDMKKNQRLSDALGVVCVAFVFAGCAEGLDGGPTWWTVVCLLVAGLFGWLSYKTTPEQKPKNR